MIAARSTSIAPVARRLLRSCIRPVLSWALVPMVFALTGCLVTDIKEYEPDPNEPPFIVYPATGTSPPLNDIVEVALDERPASMTELTFSVEIYDRNVDQPLGLRRVVNRPPVGEFLVGVVEVPANGERTRTATFRVPLGELGEGECNVVEAFVSSSFLGGVDPEETGDLAGVAWLVVPYRGTQSVDLRLGCGGGP